MSMYLKNTKTGATQCVDSISDALWLIGKYMKKHEDNPFVVQDENGKEIKYWQLDEMPFDKDGCHATGIEVLFPGDEPCDTWYEYVTSDGTYFYGR